MPPHRLISEESRIDHLTAELKKAVDEVDDSLQRVFANHLVLASAGFVESSVANILAEYGRRNGNESIRRFVEKSVARNNSLNCEKIKVISDQFDPSWWPSIEGSTLPAQRDAVDSLKTLRDQIAHGKTNGTGFSTVRSYYMNVKPFVRQMSQSILGY